MKLRIACSRILAGTALILVVGFPLALPYVALAADDTTKPPAADTAAAKGAVTTATTPAPAATQPAANTSGPGFSFIPLTSITGIGQAGATPDIPAFLNNLYKICIGLAAALAVIKIVQGGVVYMLGDSVTETREARHHIAMAVFGLVLVLSPAIVFGIIDPRILDLNIDLSGLTPPATTHTDIDPTGQVPCLSGDCKATAGNTTDPANSTQTPTAPGAVGQGTPSDGTAAGGNPATGCNPGYIPSFDSDGNDACVPDTTGDASNGSGGSVELRICVDPAQGSGTRYVYLGYSVGHTQEGSGCTTTANGGTSCNSTGPVSADACTTIQYDDSATTLAGCQANIAHGANFTNVISCTQYAVGTKLDPSVPAPLCPGVTGYTATSDNVDKACPTH